MIQVTKLRNVFGITDVIGMDQLGRFNIIYAPNGTAKTSLSDALYSLQNGNVDGLQDVYEKNVAPVEFEINVNGQVSKTGSVISYEIIRYSGVDEYPLIGKAEYTTLVASADIIKKVQEYLGKYLNAVTEIYGILTETFPKRGGRIPDKYAKALAVALGVPNIDDQEVWANAFLPVANRLNSSLAFSLSVDEFAEYLNPTFVKAIGDPRVQEHLSFFLEKMNKSLAEGLFDSAFSVDDLQEVVRVCEEHHFFDSERRAIFINDRKWSLPELKKEIEDGYAKLYESPEGKTAFFQVKESLPKNGKAVQTLSNAKKRPELLRAFSDIQNLGIIALSALLDASQIERIEKQKEIAEKHRANISAIVDKYDGEGATFDNLWKRFVARFACHNFELRIENRADAISGKSLPHFVAYSTKDGKGVDDPKKKRFSTGEARIFYFARLALDIELAISSKQPVTIILDDAVESFDYKNKRAFIEYLNDARIRGENLQFLVFTHNFDFFRSLALACNKKERNLFFAFAKEKGVVCFERANQDYYLGLASFNDWLNQDSVDYYIALIPFLRNIIQLTEGDRNSKDTRLINDYLHYRDETMDCSTLQELFNTHQSRVKFPSKAIPKYGKYYPANVQTPYYELVSRVANEIIIHEQKILETSLQTKIVLGLYVRLAYEKFLFDKAMSLGKTFDREETNWDKRIMSELQDDKQLSEEEVEYLIRARVVAPPYAHVNSFMYEPLIDVGADYLIKVARWFANQNPQ